MKTFRCIIHDENFAKTETGKQKIWRTDAIPTFCCEAKDSFFVWGRNTKYNNYNGYYGYVDSNLVVILEDKFVL